MQLPTQNKLESMSKEEFDSFLVDIEGSIDLLSEEQLQDLQGMISKVEDLSDIEKARTDFKTFVKLCGNKVLKFSSKGQHDLMCLEFEELVNGSDGRLTLSLPPRNGKSEFGSICLPAWALGKHPDWKIIQASAGDKLAANFGRQVKAIIDSPLYKKIFPGISLSKDSKANSRFATNHNGMYYAVGVGTNLAGWGANLLICDDLITEKIALSGNADLYEDVWNWVTSGAMPRLQPEGRVLHIATRWSKQDPIGRINLKMKEDPTWERYKSIVISALDEIDESTFPEIWTTKALHTKRATMLPYMWNAQYMQKPNVASGAIISRDKWKKWDQFKKIPNSNEVEFVPPKCGVIMMVMDTAYTNNKRSNPTAVTIWGCFSRVDPESGNDIANIILLHSYKKKMEFPELKRQSKEWIKEWEPDIILIEGKSSGPMLISELNQAGIPAISVVPKPLEDKISRLNSVTSVFFSGRVWYMPTYANEQTIEEVNDFPLGDSDDLVDTTAYAVRHFRNTGMIAPADDREWKVDEGTTQGRSYY